MTDHPDVVSAALDHGPTAVGAVGLYLAAKEVLGPTLKTLGIKLEDALFGRRGKNAEAISQKAQKLSDAHAREDSGLLNIRVVGRVLNDATLYDDDVQQTYVAGMLAGSRNEDGSDDRPIYYLTLIDGLTADQLRIFHVLYTAVAQKHTRFVSQQGPVINEVAVLRSDVEGMLAAFPDGERDIPMSVFFQLEQAGLIAAVHTGANSRSEDTVWFMATRVGALLFDWAHGFADEDFAQFGMRNRPDIGLPAYEFDRSMWQDGR